MQIKTMRVQALPIIGLLILSGCTSLQGTPPDFDTVPSAAWPQQLERMAQARTLPNMLLLGEQHDAPEHQQWERTTVQWLAQRGQLAALVMEMAQAGSHTERLPATATPEQVQSALDWKAAGWPWERYAEVVMAAVQAGVPVYGGNLPRADMRAVMVQPHWDNHLPAPAWQRQREAIDTGHCGLLPATQLTPMARVQLAKDARMAATAAAHMTQGKTVLLIAGRGHVLRSVGIPTWLPANVSTGVAVAETEGAPPGLRADRDWLVQTRALPPEDHCAPLRAQWTGKAPGTPAPAAASAAPK